MNNISAMYATIGDGAAGSAEAHTRREINVPVNGDIDIVTARQKGRELARDLGFTSIDLALITTAVSELARNMILYANGGQILLAIVEKGNWRGLKVMARDHGPGIPDIERAMEEGFSTSGSLGLGLPGVKRLMDEFDIVSQIGRGTTVTVKKWKLMKNISAAPKTSPLRPVTM